MFTVFFIGEAVVKVKVFGWKEYACGADWYWSWSLGCSYDLCQTLGPEEASLFLGGSQPSGSRRFCRGLTKSETFGRGSEDSPDLSKMHFSLLSSSV